MPIEVICKGCARKLRVADENAGKTARCPSCGETFTVPMGASATTSPAAPAFGSGAFGSAGFAPTEARPGTTPLPSDKWFLKTEEGATYGPAGKAELDSWVAEGRVTANAQLLREGETAWQPAKNIYPTLVMGGSSSNAGSGYAPPPQPGAGPAPNPFRDVGANPYASPTGVSGGQTYGRTGMINGRYVQPHRGGAILTLGILGLCLCAFLGIAAVVMASQDLKLMNEGRMDASGKGMTIAGLVLGIICCVLFVLGFLINIAGGFR